MKKPRSILKIIFCPPAAVGMPIAVLGLGFVAVVLLYDVQNPVLRYGSYLASAYALIISVTLAVGFFRLHSPKKALYSTKIGNKYLTDPHFKNRVSLAFGLAVNLTYIAIKLFSGIFYHSSWFIALAVYYILLAIMRFGLIHPCGSISEELGRCRSCGFILLAMTIALGGIAVFMVYQNRHFSYPGYLIYAMAAYSFYAVITAIVNIFKTRKFNSPIISAAKSVNLVAALVSILALTTAMIAQFGDDDPEFRMIMVGAVGGAVCAVAMEEALRMILQSGIKLKREKGDDGSV